MSDVNSIVPILAIGASMGVVPVLLSARSADVREGWTLAAGLAKLALVLSMLPGVLAGKTFLFKLADVFPGASIAFRVDAMGILFALISSSLWIVTSVYSIGYMRGLKEHAQTRYYCYFALALCSTLGVAFSANLLTLYLFYELLSFATYPLVTHHQDQEARSAGRRYLLFIVGGSVGLVLPAMLACYGTARTLDFSPGGILGSAGFSDLELSLLMLMFLFGFAKAAIMPLHGWLPAAMVAPTPVSALLHAVAVVKVGVFSILRVLTGIFGLELLGSSNLDSLVLALAAVTMVAASLVALCQDGLKRMLAYSTVGQLSYIILGGALISPEGLQGALTHMATHALGKISLFFCAGAIYVATGKQRISQLNGIARRMPLTMVAFLVASLSIIGLPPMAGFLSKWYLALGCVGAEQNVCLAVLLLSSLLNAGYLMPVVYRAFFLPIPDGEPTGRLPETSSLCTWAPMLTALGCVIIFLFPGVILDLTSVAVRQVWGS
ncbi:MAG: monovalent cation/H+ antiporter subunit D family protein [bacterium]